MKLKKVNLFIKQKWVDKIHDKFLDFHWIMHTNLSCGNNRYGNFGKTRIEIMFRLYDKLEKE